MSSSTLVRTLLVISNHNSNSDELNQREDAMAYTTTEYRDRPDFICTWIQRLIEFLQDLVFLCLHPSSSPLLSSVWASLSCRFSQYSNLWQLTDYTLIASSSSVLGNASPPLDPVWAHISILLFKIQSMYTKHNVWQMSSM